MFMPLVERAILTGGTCNQPILEFRVCADLIHAGGHVTQLKLAKASVESSATMPDQSATAKYVQQVADGTFVTTIHGPCEASTRRMIMSCSAPLTLGKAEGRPARDLRHGRRCGRLQPAMW